MMKVWVEASGRALAPPLAGSGDLRRDEPIRTAVERAGRVPHDGGVEVS